MIPDKLIAFIRQLFTLGFVPVGWRLPIFALLGVAAGLALLTVRVSEVYSYASDAPEACVNCHIMRPQYATWARSSHAYSATCNDCHVPHDNVVKKYAFKAYDGTRHGAIFTLRREPQVIRASRLANTVIQGNCRECHARKLSGAFLLREGERDCTDCHRDVPHGDVAGLASTPNAQTPHLKPLSILPSSGESTDAHH